jgi:hypothetical protein
MRKKPLHCANLEGEEKAGGLKKIFRITHS